MQTKLTKKSQEVTDANIVSKESQDSNDAQVKDNQNLELYYEGQINEMINLSKELIQPNILESEINLSTKLVKDVIPNTVEQVQPSSETELLPVDILDAAKEVDGESIEDEMVAELLEVAKSLIVNPAVDNMVTSTTDNASVCEKDNKKDVAPESEAADVNIHVMPAEKDEVDEEIFIPASERVS